MTGLNLEQNHRIIMITVMDNKDLVQEVLIHHNLARRKQVVGVNDDRQKPKRDYSDILKILKNGFVD